MKKITLFCLALCAMAFSSLPLRALDEVLIDSIYYKLNDSKKTASVQRYVNVSYYENVGTALEKEVTAPKPAKTYTGKLPKLVIPSQVKHNGKTYTVTRVKCIYQGARSHEHGYIDEGTSITEIVLPGTITTIDDYAFGYLDDLKRINIPANLDSMPTYNMFAYPWPEEYYRCPSNGDCSDAGQHNIDLDHLIIETPVVLKYYSKQYYNMIEWQTNQPTRLRNLALEGRIDSITLLGNAGDSIYAHTFREWIGLKYVNLPKSNTQFIGVHAFDSCVNLRTINMDEVKVLKMVSDYAFRNCISLGKGDIPESVINVGSGVFQNCKLLNHATLPSAFTYVPQYMYENTGIGLEINLSENIKRICESAFKNCNLEELTLPSKIELIEDMAFQSAYILGNKDLVLPKSLGVLGNYAFHSSNLKSVTVNSELSYLGKGIFSQSEVETVTINKADFITRAAIEGGRHLVPSAQTSRNISLMTVTPFPITFSKAVTT